MFDFGLRVLLESFQFLSMIFFLIRPFLGTKIRLFSESPITGQSVGKKKRFSHNLGHNILEIHVHHSKVVLDI